MSDILPDHDLLESTLREGGIEAAVRILNDRVPHCYTGVYQLAGNVLRCEMLYDKQHEVIPDLLAAVPLEDSFCHFGFQGQSLTDEELENMKQASRSMAPFLSSRRG